MKSMFDPVVSQEILRRLEQLTPSASRQWGKMSPSQMLEHSARAVEMALGRGKQSQVWLGKLIGWMFKSQFLGEKPFQKNAPTGPDFVIRDEPDFAEARNRLANLVRELHAMGESGADGHVHGFFGPLRGAEWGVTQYKHLDHHLRQFGA